MVEIRNRGDLEDWLEDRPRKDAVAIAARAALRVLPLIAAALGQGANSSRTTIIMPVFRAVGAAVGGAVGFYGDAKAWEKLSSPLRGATIAGADAAAAINSFASQTPLSYAVRSAHLASEVIYNAAEAFDEYTERASYLSRAAAGDASWAAAAAEKAFESSRVWMAVSHDATALEHDTPPERLAALPLWPKTPPEVAINSWHTLRKRLIAVDEGWEVWTDWYEDRLHGRRFDEALEEARVLIDPALWDQGPKAVNAEIKRLIEEHRTHKGPVPQDFDQPELPGQRPTPIQFEFRDGALHRAAHEPPHPPEERRAAAQRGWRALQEMLGDFLTVGGGHQSPRLKLVLERCQVAMGASFEGLEVILLGAHAARLQGYAERAAEVLMPEDAADLVALNAQLALFLAQFPEWADYASGIGGGFGTPEAEQKAVADSAAAIEHVAEAAPVLITLAARDGLAELEEAATPEPTAAEPAPIAPPIQRRSYLRAVRSALGALSGQAVADVRAGASKGVQKHVESTTVAALAGAQGYLIALATGLPGEFGWLAGLVTYFTRMLGPSTGGAQDERGSSEKDNDLAET